MTPEQAAEKGHRAEDLTVTCEAGRHAGAWVVRAGDKVLTEGHDMTPLRFRGELRRINGGSD